jgi:hypothetical protein
MVRRRIASEKIELFQVVESSIVRKRSLSANLENSDWNGWV